MPDSKISALTQATLPDLGDEFAVNQALVSKKETLGSLEAAIGFANGRGTLSGSARMTLDTTMRWAVSDAITGSPLTLGVPRAIAVPAVIPDGYDADLSNRLTLAALGRLSVIGRGRLSIDQQDFMRSRLTLTGTG